MFAEERRRKILDILKARGKVRVSDLSKRFGVSSVTIRKDLEYLESTGALVRTHGGAVLPDHSRSEWHFLKKIHQKEDEKNRIALKAMEYVKEGDTIILDSSSTTYYIALLIKEGGVKHLTVVTNNIFIAKELIDTGLDLVVLGGNIRENSLSLVGPWTMNFLREINVDKAFMGTTGFSKDKGFMTPSLVEAEVKREMINSSDEVFIVTDSTKFSRIAFATFAMPEDVDYVITDTDIPQDCEEFLEEREVKVIKV